MNAIKFAKYSTLLAAVFLTACGGGSGSVENPPVDTGNGGKTDGEGNGNEGNGNEGNNGGNEGNGNEGNNGGNTGGNNGSETPLDASEPVSIKLYPRVITSDVTQIVAVGTNADGEQMALTHRVTWSSSNNSAVQVDSVTGAISINDINSTARITATYVNNLSQSLDYQPSVSSNSFTATNFQTFAEDGSLTVYFSNDSTPNIYAWTNNGMAAGDWPGTAMSSSDSQGDGWYEYTFSADNLDNGSINIIFNWNNAEQQTENLSRSVNDGDGAYDYQTNSWTNIDTPSGNNGNTNQPPATDNSELIVYFQSTAQPSIYAWNDAAGTPAGDWPGSPMTSASSLGDNWYSYSFTSNQLDNGQTSIIFNWNNAEEQTQNLSRSSNEGNARYDLASQSWVSVEGGGTGGPGTGNPTGEDVLVVCGSTTMVVTVGNSSANICDTEKALLKENAVLNIEPGPIPFGSQGFDYWSGTGHLYTVNPLQETTRMLVVVPDEPVYTNNKVTIAIQPIFAGGDPFASARNQYISQCASCHGREGEGDANGAFPLMGITNRYTLSTMTTKIEDTMPVGGVSTCVGSCAADIAEMIMAQAFEAPELSCNADDPAIMVTQQRNLKALNETEFNNTITDLLELSEPFNASTHGNKFTDGSNPYPTGNNLLIDDSRLFKLDNAVSKILEEIESIGGMYQLVNNCGNADCFIDQFGLKLFRRPLTTTEKQRYKAVYDETEETGLLKALFHSPNFIYRSELGERRSDGLYELNDFEMASLLSYTYWGTTPDNALLSAAAAGQLSTDAQIRSQVDRMLSDEDKLERGIRRFIGGWLFNDRYTFKLSDATKQYEDDLTEETYQVVLRAIKENKQFSELMTADYTYANKSVAEFYGLPSVSSDNRWEKRYYRDINDESANDRQGLLAHASFLSTRAAVGQNNVIQRGVYVRRNILCQDFGTPLGAGDELEAGQGHEPEHSNREFVEIHTENSVCASCHQFIDGIGFGLDRYGSESEWRDYERVFYTENNELTYTDVPVEPQGEVKSLLGALNTVLDPNTPLTQFSGIKELSNLIDETNHASACFARQFHRFAIGELETDFEANASSASNSCVIHSYSKGMQNGSQGIRDALIEYSQSINFKLRLQ